jgi:hypothetical protein
MIFLYSDSYIPIKIFGLNDAVLEKGIDREDWIHHVAYVMVVELCQKILYRRFLAWMLT